MDTTSISKLGGSVEESTSARSLGGEKTSGKPAAPAAGARGDSVNLTSGAQLLSRLEESLASAPAVDSAKVAEVKSAIASGNYEIDTTSLADAILRFERSLGD